MYEVDESDVYSPCQSFRSALYTYLVLNLLAPHSSASADSNQKGGESFAAANGSLPTAGNETAAAVCTGEASAAGCQLALSNTCAGC